MANQPIKTCGQCNHAARMKFPGMQGFAWYCKKDEYLIPQSTTLDKESGDWETVFTRVPLECPRPDDEVRKTAEALPPKDWVTVTFRD